MIDQYPEAEEVYCDEFYNLYRSLKGGSGVPTFIIPPFAGRKGRVVLPLIKKCEKTGRPVWWYELKSATQATKNLDVAGLISILRQSTDIITNCCSTDKIDVVGTCQGGWLAALFTSFYPERVRKLAAFVAPINLKTGQKNAIESYCETISLPAHKMLVDLNSGIQPGLAQWLAFASMAPMQVFYGRYLDLLGHVVNDRPAGIEKWGVNEGWYDDPNDLAGVWFLDVLENHFAKNRLYDGTWNIGGQVADLGNITCPVYVFAGGKDDITSTKQALDLLKKVGSVEKHGVIFPEAGHTRAFTGAAELDEFAEMFLHEKYVQVPEVAEEWI